VHYARRIKCHQLGNSVPERRCKPASLGYGIPAARNGDYAFLLHLITSLKSKGKGAIILPHGVLFRGHKEADIRRNLIQRGLIKGIIGLPANLFYGTGMVSISCRADGSGRESHDP